MSSPGVSKNLKHRPPSNLTKGLALTVLQRKPIDASGHSQKEESKQSAITEHWQGSVLSTEEERDIREKPESKKDLL